MECVIGVDIGTQGTKSVLIDLEKGVLTSAYRGYQPSTPKPLHAEQWPEVWESAVEEVIKEVVESGYADPASIKGVAISSLYGGSGIPVDKNIKAIHPCLIWMDRRATKEVEWVKEHIDLDHLYDVTGNYVDSYYGFTKILWLKNNKPDVWKRTKYLLPPNAYVIYKLTGELAVDYSSAGNIGGVFDIKQKQWSDDMLKQMDIPREFFPERLVDSSEIVGQVNAEGSAKTGLQAGTPIIAGGVDAPVATLAAGAFEPGTHVAMVGTSMCWGFVTENTNLSKGLVSMPHVLNAKKYVYSFGGAITAGAVVNWFKDQLGGAEEAAARLTSLSVYDVLEKESERIPAGSDGIVVLPYFMGERNPIWDPYASGTVLGLNLTHTRAHLYRAFMEGVAYSLRHNMEEVFHKLDLNDEIILVGGAAKSKMWTKIFSDVTGYQVKIIKEEVEAPLGDALLAALGTGLIKDPKALLKWFTFEAADAPDPEAKKVYDRRFKIYKDAYANLKSTMRSMHDTEA